MSEQSEIERLVEQAYSAGSKAETARILDQAIQLADAANDTDQAWWLRTQIFEPAVFGGQIDLLLVHFAKALAMSDKEPDKYDITDLLWPYKWAIDSAPIFPHVPLAKLHGLVDDFARRMAERGEGERVSHYMRLQVALSLGDIDLAEKELAVYEKLERDHWSDCAACEADRLVQLAIARREDEVALERAKPLLSGRMVCHDVPTQTYGWLQIPALRLGRMDLCQQFFLKGFAKALKEDNMMHILGQHLQMLALTHNTVRGLETISRLFSRALATPEVLFRWYFWLGAELVMHRLADRGTVKIALPDTYEGYQKSGEYKVADLLAYFKKQVDGLAAQFDKRNGNTWYADHAKHIRGLLDKVEPFELKAPPERKPRVRKPKPVDDDTALEDL